MRCRGFTRARGRLSPDRRRVDPRDHGRPRRVWQVGGLLDKGGRPVAQLPVEAAVLQWRVEQS
eukprot:7381745-Prymnesium_polylepis.1